MSKRAKLIIGSLGLLALAILAVALFLRYELTKSFPDTTGTLRISGLHGPVDVLRDSFGVPRIRAGNEHDLMFGLGFVHAQDRLWQMDISRRAAAGRLSELFGRETVDFDRMFRVVGLQRIAEVIEGHLSAESRNRIQSYSDGVNAFLEAHRGKYPVEFDLLNYQPEPWTVLHTIMVGRLTAWELNLSWWTDLTYGEIADRVGLDKILDILPTYPADVPPVVPPQVWSSYASLGNGYLRTAREFCAFAGLPGLAGGSNAWAVSPRLSATAGVLLANDTHLPLQLPSRWYEVQLHAGDYDVSGMSVAGIPAVIAGRNARIAWGVTNVMADDADFYVERVDSVDSTKYLYDGTWQPMTVLHEEIRVRGDSAVPLTIRLTRHGPVVTDIRRPLLNAAYPYVTSMRWTGAEIDDEFAAFDMIDRARNWKEFTDGVRRFTVPGQNFVYGDVDGNIGYWCGVRLPIRGKQNSLFPLPGWDRASEWSGFVPFDRLPHLYNPPEGYIATANNRIVDDSYPYYISDLWEPPSRILRLIDVLGKPNELFSVEDFERLQNDQVSYNAREIVPYILAAFRDSSLGVAGGERVFEYLRNWNFVFGKDDIATAIFQQFFVRLLDNTYRDEMGDAIFHDFLILGNIPIRVTTRLIKESMSPWFDDARTSAVETRDDIIRKSLREATLLLRDRFGNDSKTWRWGDMHTVSLRHPFGLVKPLDKVFNIGPFPYGGGQTSLVSGEYSYNEPFEVAVGASFRQIFDMKDPLEWRAILPSGESGQVLNAHYGDQTELWLHGGYRIVRSSEEGGKWEHLRLEPAR